MLGQLYLPTKRVLGSPITALSFDDQIQIMLDWASQRESRAVCVANVHMVMEAHWHPSFADVLEKADLVTPDGMPVVWMMRLLGTKKQERVAGMDILLALCHLAQLHQISIFFLGSCQKILEPMERRLRSEFPYLPIAGIEPLPFRPLTPAEDKALMQKINASRAGLVFVSLGCPKQEYWIAQHREQISAVMIGLGGAFPVYARIHNWAPQWVRKSGLEWLYRLLQEPRRLWRRYTKTIPAFIWLAWRQLRNRHH